MGDCIAMTGLYGAVAFRYDQTSDAAIMTLIGADGVNPVSISNALVTETMAHARIGSGSTFVHNNVHNGIASGASHYHAFVTGAKTCHLTIYSATANSAPIWVEIAEAGTYTGGTAGAINNKNRNSATTPTAAITEGVTMATPGTHLEGDYASGTKQSGGGASIEEEWILKPSTIYLFLVRNDSIGAANISFHLEWYEV